MSSTTGETGQQGLVDQASSKAEQIASTAQEKASELKEQGKSQVAGRLDERTTNVGSQARSFAGAIRRTSDDLRREGNGGAASAAEQVAERIERLGSYLEQKNGDQLLRDVEEFARKRPWLVAGAAAIVGVAASRFLKASSEQRYGPNGSGSRMRSLGAERPGAWVGSTPTGPQEPVGAPVASERFGTVR